MTIKAETESKESPRLKVASTPTKGLDTKATKYMKAQVSNTARSNQNNPNASKDTATQRVK